MKRLSRVLAALVLAAAVGCGRAPEAPPKTTIVRHLLGDPLSLDPITTTEEAGVLVDDLIFRPLVGVDGRLEPVAGLASSWTVSPDGLVYEFHLDPKYTWESGLPVTSDDVRFTIEHVRDPRVSAPQWRALFEDLAAIETPDAATVRVRFARPYAERMQTFTLPVVSAAAYGRAKDPAEMARHPIGSGPYRLESWESNQKVRLVRRDGPASTDAHFDEVVFRIIPEGSVRYQAGLRGELDEFRLSRDQRKPAEANPEFTKRFRVIKVPQFLQALLIWNCRNPLLADSRVRLALARSWPRADTLRRLYPPDGAALTSGPYPPNVPENAPGLEPPSYDPAESARLLEQAGWKPGPDGIRRKGGRKASIEMIYPAGQPIYEEIGEILRGAYAKVGVELVLRKLEWAAFSERSGKGESDAMFYGRIFAPPNADPYPYYHSSQFAPGGQNLGFYASAEADRLMEAARVELDPGKRLELYRQVARLFATDQPADFLFGAEQYWAMAHRVENVEVSVLGLFHFLPGPLGWRPVSAASR
ncbi:MAG TPA: ABC transporter substrate-binding protein [Thermoanaerobaculia bacterium]|nr:ABC transporter substrate-binding protein [Thermoanaerobaculia bacterium]